MTKIEHCVGILPLREVDGDYQVLLALHSKGEYWSFPKGHLEEGESLKEGAKRELFEETNLEVQNFLNLAPFKEDYIFNLKDKKIHKYVEYFPALVKGDIIIKEPHEIKDLQWFFLNEALEKITFEQSQNILKNFIQLIKN